MTTASVSTAPGASRAIDRVALRVGTALVLWAGRRTERNALTSEQRTHRIALERLQLDRAAAAQRTSVLR